MYDMGDDSRSIDGCEEGYSAPREGMLITRSADDAKTSRRRKVFDCLADESERYTVERVAHLPVTAPPTAPHPVSPKFEMTLCRKAV